MAAQVNRRAGFYADPKLGIPVREIIGYIPRALEHVMKEKEAKGYYPH
jgi:hypothetical protein